MNYPSIKDILSKNKLIPKYFIVLILGITFMLAGSWLGRETKDTPKASMPEDEEAIIPETTEKNWEDKLQKELEIILQEIDGLGQVSVYLFFSNANNYEYAVNRETTERKTEEDDGAGGARIIEEMTSRDNYVILRSEGGLEKPLLVQKNYPSISGILVVADGAERAVIKDQIVRALVSLLDVGPHRISVLPGKNFGR